MGEAWKGSCTRARRVLCRRLGRKATLEHEVRRDAKGCAKLLYGQALERLEGAARLWQLAGRRCHLVSLGEREQ